MSNDPDCSDDNPLFERMEQPGIGEVLTPGQPLTFSATERESLRPAPLLGQHTDEILADILGLSSEAIGKLHDKQVVAGPPR